MGIVELWPFAASGSVVLLGLTSRVIGWTQEGRTISGAQVSAKQSRPTMTQVLTDLHVWRLGQKIYSAIISVRCT